jgi:type I restriction enzyme S subunit
VSAVLERVFDIAERSKWQIKALGDVCRTSSGGTPSRSRPDYFNGNIPWVKSGELTDGLVSEVSEFISEEALAGSSAKLLPAGTLLIAMYGATVGKLGVLARAAATNQAVCAIFPPPELDPKFLFWYLRRQRFNLIAKAVGGAQPNISQTILRDLELPIPPLSEQREIVAELEKQFSRLDEAVANLQRVKANLKRYKASLLKSAVEGRLVETEASIAHREGRSYETGDQLLQRILEERRAKWTGRGAFVAQAPSFDEPTLIPDGWAVGSLDQLSNVVRGGSPRPAGDPRYFGGPVPWITVGSVTCDESDYLRQASSGLTEEGKERSRFIEEHTLLLTNSGATLGVPKISLISGCINDGVAALLDVEYPLKQYLVHFLRTKTDSLRQVNQGAAQPNLNTTIIKAMPVPLPPLAEQPRILAEVDRHLSIVREVEAEVDNNLKRAQALRQVKLAEAFSSRQ